MTEKTKKAKKVIVIPARENRNLENGQEKNKRRVAAYARVSTNKESQQTSYEAQVHYYMEYIEKRTDWSFAGMYAEEGVTGTSTRKRMEFQRMIEDAVAGKIDLIITKSVSRFARNTVDSLTAIRQLKEHGVECYFEKENIWTFDAKGELLITIMSSLAQEESRSISENTRWGMRKAFQNGKVFVPFRHFLGYDRRMTPREQESVLCFCSGTRFHYSTVFYGFDCFAAIPADHPDIYRICKDSLHTDGSPVFIKS